MNKRISDRLRRMDYFTLVSDWIQMPRNNIKSNCHGSRVKRNRNVYIFRKRTTKSMEKSKSFQIKYDKECTLARRSEYIKPLGKKYRFSIKNKKP